ncbi:hypothetical protein DL93DRAFT_2196684 [Clavulina sp. PMI_390]|nr:hypothetical protein DL93DRAFT_2196684 [Clavulina sp. PMI_390]
MHAPQPPQGPALFLYPTNDSFVPKMISLTPSGNRVKIGRQTNTKTVPGERNGYFDSKVLSRQHAEVWEENGKIYIKDVKSSNGTFVNGERLSVEGMESDPWELKTDDRVEFGIDIVGEDNKTIIHHKVAATVFCVITPDDYAQLSMHHPGLQSQHHTSQTNGAYHMQNQARRPSLQQTQSPIGLGGLGGGPALGLSGRTGKSGLTFDHILNRLQNELQKSRDTGSELTSLTSVMTDIHESVGGAALVSYILSPFFFQPSPAPPSIQSLHNIPPVRPPTADIPQSTSDPSVDLASLQSQLLQTQSVLASHADKVKTIESVIAEHDSVKHELQLMRDLMEQRKAEMETMISRSHFESNGNGALSHIHAESESDIDDDARSVITLMPDDEVEGTHATHSTSLVSHDGESARLGEDEDRPHLDIVDRPRTPEPHGLAMTIGDEDDDETDSQDLPSSFDQTMVPESMSTAPDHPLSTSPLVPISVASDSEDQPHSFSSPSTKELHEQNELLSNRLDVLSQQLDVALDLSRQLQGDAEAAQQSMIAMEAKVKALEAMAEQLKLQQIQHVAEEQAAEVERREGASKHQTSMTEAWETWRLRVEGQWRTEREEWDAERARLQQAVRDWESRVGEMEQRDHQRTTESSELLTLLREEASLARKRREEHDVEIHDESSDDDSEAHYKTNGILGKGSKARRVPAAGKTSKTRKRHSSSSAVATPPHSPSTNGDVLTERSSEASSSRPTSPEPSISGSLMDAYTNGHVKPQLLPLSPAPSVRHGARTESASSEPESMDDHTGAPSIGHLAPPSPNSTKMGSSRRLPENVRTFTALYLLTG